MKTYSECILLPTFKERFEYLKLTGVVGEETFGRARSLNQVFYHSPEWRKVRDEVIIRDGSCDLAIPDRYVRRYVIVHHINPVTEAQIRSRDKCLWDPENLICVHRRTHNAIHYGDISLLYTDEPNMDRKPNDTCLWKGGK